MYADLFIFVNNPIFGVGPGIGYYERLNHGLSQRVSAHTEYSRLLAEHGIAGIFVLLFILYKSFFILKNSKI